MSIYIPMPTYKEIPLTQNQVALVDTEDYDRVNQYKWFAAKMGRTYYAGRQIRLNNGKQKTIYMHYFIMNTSPTKNIEIDHKNPPGTDNRKENLRKATKQQNQHNQQKILKSTSSIFKGVHLVDENKWRARININYKRIHLGYFKDEIEAAKAYNNAAIIYFREFAKLNDI